MKTERSLVDEVLSLSLHPDHNRYGRDSRDANMFKHFVFCMTQAWNDALNGKAATDFFRSRFVQLPVKSMLFKIGGSFRDPCH